MGDLATRPILEEHCGADVVLSAHGVRDVARDASRLSHTTSSPCQSVLLSPSPADVDVTSNRCHDCPGTLAQHLSRVTSRYDAYASLGRSPLRPTPLCVRSLLLSSTRVATNPAATESDARRTWGYPDSPPAGLALSAALLCRSPPHKTLRLPFVSSSHLISCTADAVGVIFVTPEERDSFRGPGHRGAF
ncbi:hypothetical protein OH77DRAFT_477826 [Trametes cingulata]|nr:hypothetical protein OH77DRAFT_477826 [Trametes cingulata]